MSCTAPEDESTDSAALDAAVTSLGSSASTSKLLRSGDGQVGRWAATPKLYPEVAEIIAGGTQALSRILPRFEEAPAADQEELLAVCAYVVAEINDSEAMMPLADFLDENMNGPVPHAIQAATHALRHLYASHGGPSNPIPPSDAAYYLQSDIEATVAAVDELDETTAKRIRRAVRSAVGARTKPSRAARDAVTARQVCYREFYVVDDSGMQIKRNGEVIRVGGVVSNPQMPPVPESVANEYRERVQSGGGEYFHYKDPRSGVVFEGEPSRWFNCAGFAFRSFVGGTKWNADAPDMFRKLTAAGLLEEAVDGAEPGDLAFFFLDGNVKHVAEVEQVGWLGGITVINADTVSGMFRAAGNANCFSNYTGGYKVYRWTNGKPPSLEPVPYKERSKENSCWGKDTNGDGWPDEDLCGCPAEDTCIDASIDDQRDNDKDGAVNCADGCPDDPQKTQPGACGCGNADTDTDRDGTPDCNDGCPNDPRKIRPGNSGCGVAEMLITNGNFESGFPGGGSYVEVGQDTIPGWRLARSQWAAPGDEVIWRGPGTLWQQIEGSYHVFLGYLGLQTTFEAMPGQTYAVSFYMTGLPRSDKVALDLTFGNGQIGFQVKSFEMNTIGKTVDNLGWVLQSCTFTVPASASGAQVVGLSFTGGVGGPTIDAVSVQ